MTNLEGQVVGRYRVDRLLRQGGMGAVFLGEHVETGSRVAIKVQHADAVGRTDLAARFDREAEVMGRLSGCRHVVGVHDVGLLPDGRRFLVMDFIRGTDLHDLLAAIASADERIEVERACSIIADVAAGLDAAHGHDVVHRDLKPANIMIESDREGAERAKVLDFGVSADLGERGRKQALTAFGEILGTPQYMAPEQAVGISNVTAVDVYALGAILHQMLSGAAPAPEGWKVTKVPLAEVRSGVPPRLAALIDRMLERDGTKRVQSMREVQTELEAVVADYNRPDNALAYAERSSPHAVAGELELTTASTAGATAVVRPPARQAKVAIAGQAQAVQPAQPAEAVSRHGARQAVSSANGEGSREASGSASVASGRAASGRAASVWGPVAVAAVALLGIAAWWIVREAASLPDAITAVAAAPPSTSPAAASASPPSATPAATAAALAPDRPAAAPAAVAPGAAVAPTAAPQVAAKAARSPEPTEPTEPAEPEPAAKPPAAKPRNTPKPSAAPKPGPDCEGVPAKAAAAQGRADWKSVLAATKTRACWTGAQSTARRRMRVKAQLELKRYDACLREGKGATDSKIAKMLSFCERKLAQQ